MTITNSERSLLLRFAHDVEAVLSRAAETEPALVTKGGRVRYAPVKGRRKPKTLTARAAEVLAWIEAHPRTQATSKALQDGLSVNRNVIAGAVFELRQRGLVRSEAII